MRNKTNGTKALSRDLVEVCKRSNANTKAVIEALSVVLGMVIIYTAESEAMACEMTDFALQTMHDAIASQAKSKQATQRRAYFN
jgi:hypothetical protein